VPDEKLGETVMAVIVPKLGAAPSEEALAQHCRQSLGGYKIPRRFAFVEKLPRSAMGKVLKTELRKSHSETN
jgi:acyl-CoA synthetase (AMP-forming)/AMP-acid ligase II